MNIARASGILKRSIAVNGLIDPSSIDFNEGKMSLKQFLKRLFGGKKASSNVGDWRFQYEDHADSQRHLLETRPVSELLKDVSVGHVDEYHQIWYVIAAKAEPKAAAPILLDALCKNPEYLHQYHCTVAILHLLGIEPLVNGRSPNDSTAVDYTTSRPNHEEARRRLQALISVI